MDIKLNHNLFSPEYGDRYHNVYIHSNTDRFDYSTFSTILVVYKEHFKFPIRKEDVPCVYTNEDFIQDIKLKTVWNPQFLKAFNYLEDCLQFYNEEAQKLDVIRFFKNQDGYYFVTGDFLYIEVVNWTHKKNEVFMVGNGKIECIYKYCISLNKQGVESCDKDESVQQPYIVKEKENLDRVRIGKSVYHKAFGEGTVIELDIKKNRIVVSFSTDVKTFIYPDAFDKEYLSLTPNKK